MKDKKPQRWWKGMREWGFGWNKCIGGMYRPWLPFRALWIVNCLEKLLLPFGFSLRQNNWQPFSPDIWYAKFFLNEAMNALAHLSWGGEYCQKGRSGHRAHLSTPGIAQVPAQHPLQSGVCVCLGALTSPAIRLLASLCSTSFSLGTRGGASGRGGNNDKITQVPLLRVWPLKKCRFWKEWSTNH